MTNLIYGLRDPRNDVYCYIGKTTIGLNRPLMHLTKSHNEKINEWVKYLEQLGFIPYVDVIEKDIALEELAEKEKYWVSYYYEINPNLLNIQLIPNNINRIRSQQDDDKFDILIKSIFDIGNILRTERISRKITQENLSKRTGLSRSTISLCESGNNIRIDVIKKYLLELKGLDILTKNLDCIRVSK